MTASLESNTNVEDNGESNLNSVEAKATEYADKVWKLYDEQVSKKNTETQNSPTQTAADVLNDIKNSLSKEDSDSSKIDYKNYIEKSYQQDMDRIVSQILAVNMGWLEYKKLLAPDSIYRINPLSIKSRATYVNYNIANNNFTNKNSEIKTIDIPKLMKCFSQIQDKLLTHSRFELIKNPTIKFENTVQLQDTGEFIPVDEQEKIKQSFQNLINNKQEIVDFKLSGKADATGPVTREKPENQIIASKTLLLQKGMDVNLLNKIELSDWTKINDNFFDNLDDMSLLDQKNKLNIAWAYARALMQIDFLSKDHISLINKSQNFKITLDPKSVNLDPNNRENKWPEYTGWWIQIDTKGNEKSKMIIEKEETQDLLSFNQMQINFVAPTYYSNRSVNAGFLRFDFRDWKINIKMEPIVDDFTSLQTKPGPKQWEENSSIIEAGWKHFWDWSTIVMRLEPTDERFAKDLPDVPETTNVNEKQPYYNAFANSLGNYMKEIWQSASTTEWFIGFLKEYSDKTDKPEEKKYIEDLINVINSYNEIDKKII